MNEFIYVVRLDKKRLVEEVLQLVNDSDWDAFEKKYFDFREYAHIETKDFGRGLSREDILLEGMNWVATEESYSVDALILLLHDQLHDIYRENIDKEAWKAYVNQENMARYCGICRRYAEGYKKEECPFCGNYLTYMYLNSRADD